MEFELQKDEKILNDNCPVYPMYVYIVDGVFKRQDKWADVITVGEWKRRENIKEIRRCNLFAHVSAKLGDTVTQAKHMEGH